MDCLEGIKEIDTDSIDLIVADPPYYLGLTSNGKKGSFSDLNICKPFFKQLAEEFNRVLKSTGEIFFFTDWRAYAVYYPVLSAELPIKNLIVWDKISGPGNCYSFAHELIIYGAKGKINRGGSNVWRVKAFSSGAKKTEGEKLHLAQKPIELIEKIISDGSPHGGIVLDTFIGSGTTAVAAINMGRNYIGFEIDERNYKIAQTRIANRKKGA